MNTRILLLGMMAMIMASCTNEAEDLSTDEASNVLRISTEISTRSIIEATNFSTGDEIGLFVPGLEVYNVYASYENQWRIADDIILGSEPVPVYAYYPFGENTDGNLVAIDLLSQTDYLYGVSDGFVSAETPEAYLRFHHALARITLSLTRVAGDVGDAHVGSVAIRNKEESNVIATFGWLDVTTGSIRPDSYGSVFVTTDLTIGETAQTVDLLVMPTTLFEAGMAEVVLNIDGKDYAVDLPAATWVGGQQYTYPIGISRNGEVTIGAESVYLGFNGDDGQPLYWATHNLGAITPEDQGGLYGWGDPTGEHIEQWEYNDDYYDSYMEDAEACRAFYGGVTPLDDISGTEYDLARAMWGESWRMPTANEYALLMENCTSESVTYNGVYCIQFTSNVNGNSILLPYASYRIGSRVRWKDYTTVGVGDYSIWSYYWTSTSDGDRGNCFLIEHRRTGISMEISSMERYQGLPIRPVTSNPQ